MTVSCFFIFSLPQCFSFPTATGLVLLRFFISFFLLSLSWKVAVQAPLGSLHNIAKHLSGNLRKAQMLLY